MAKAIGWKARNSGSILLLFKDFRLDLQPTQPPIWWVQRTVSRGIKRPKPEYDRSFLSSAEIKNKWSYCYTPYIRLRDLYRNSFIFTKTQLRCDNDNRISDTPGEERVFLLPTVIQNHSLL